MKLKLAAVAVSLLLVGTGAAMAMPGNAPADAQADEHSQADGQSQADERAQNEEREQAQNGSDAADRRGQPDDRSAPAAGNGSHGPPADLPAQVPDFVSDIHDAVRNFVGGEGDSLGETVSSLTPDDGNETAASTDAPAGQ